MEVSRRQLLRTTGGAAIGGGALAVVGSSNARAEATVSGRIVASDGSGIGGRRLHSGEFDVVTDDDGSFAARVDGGGQVRLALYKSHYGEKTGLAPTRNQVPHVYGLGEYYIGSGDEDLGELKIPEASLVRLRALDSDGDPVADATPGVRHEGYGIGSYWMTTESDGWAYIRGADFAGIELAGRVKLSMEIPSDGGGAMKYEEDVTIDGPTDVVFQVGEGVSVSQSSVGSSAESTQTTTDTPAATDASGATETPTPSDTTTETGSSTPAPETATSTAERPSAPTESPRGFISNGANADDLGPLNDPFVLTVGGFALSVAGILHNMVGGA